MKAVIFIIVSVLFFGLASPDISLAGTQVNATVYWSGGIIIGGASIIFVIFIGRDKHSAKNENNKGENKADALQMQAINAHTLASKQDEADQTQYGMVKILEW